MLKERELAVVRWLVQYCNAELAKKKQGQSYDEGVKADGDGLELMAPARRYIEKTGTKRDVIYRILIRISNLEKVEYERVRKGKVIRFPFNILKLIEDGKIKMKEEEEKTVEVKTKVKTEDVKETVRKSLMNILDKKQGRLKQIEREKEKILEEIEKITGIIKEVDTISG